MKRDVDAALDRCLTWLRAGMDVESCLARYPEYADELRPLLILTTQVGRVITPAAAADARSAGEQRMLAVLAQKRERLAKVPPIVRRAELMVRRLMPTGPGGLRPAWQVVGLMTVLILLLASGLIVTASADSLPGDLLYPVKLTGQRAQLALTLDPARHQSLEDLFETQRRLDVQEVLVGGRQVSVGFQGTLLRMEGQLWIVGGLPVTLQDTTAVVGRPSLGSLVQVRGDLPGDGSIVAVWVDVEDPLSQLTDTPEPTPTRQPAETPEPAGTLKPTELPESSPIPHLTATARPTETELPTVTSEPTQTPQPTATEEAEETPATPETPNASDVPEPTESTEPGDTPEPGDEPDPEDTPHPEDTLGPDDTPESEEPEPTESTEPGDTPEPSDEPDPEDTPHPEGTPDPDDTPEPEEPEPTESTEPSDTPEPSDEPDPEDTPHPEGTPDPDDTPEPEEPESTKTPDPDDTSEPTGEPDPTEEPHD